jgi:hypothetical protein
MTTSRVAAAALPLLFVLGMPKPAAAQSAAERAAQLNDEGKKLWQEKGDVAAAAEKFRQATLLSPEGRYYFNLCYSLHQIGRYAEALTACRAVAPNGAPDDVLEKTKVVIEDLEKRVPPEDQTGDGTGQGDPGQGDPGQDGYEGDPGQDGYEGDPGQGDPPPDGTAGYENPPGGPPAPLPGLEKTAPPTDEYSWSVGGDIGLVGASVGRASYYAGAAGTFKLNASFIVVPKLHVGIQGYLGVTQLAADQADANLSLVDIGGALFKHIRRERFYVTPLVGAHITGMQPDNGLGESLFSVGVRAELAFSWILGPLRNHVLSVTPAINIYTPASGAAEEDAAFYGLDEGGATIGLTVGYTLRFMEPFGQTPLIILE